MGGSAGGDLYPTKSTVVIRTSVRVEQGLTTPQAPPSDAVWPSSSSTPRLKKPNGSLQVGWGRARGAGGYAVVSAKRTSELRVREKDEEHYGEQQEQDMVEAGLLKVTSGP